MMKNGNTDVNKRGFKSAVTDKHICFLKKWLTQKKNVGKCFNDAF